MPNPTRLRPNESVVQNINVKEQFELMLKNSYGVNASTGEAINPKTTKSSREDSAAHDLLAVSARLKDCSTLIRKAVEVFHLSDSKKKDKKLSLL